MPRNSMDFVIEGGHKLSGTTVVNASKNGAMGLMCAALLNRKATTLKNIPRIEEVNRIIEVMNSIGIATVWMDAKTLKITPPETIDMSGINRESAAKTRTILMFMGALVHRKDLFQNSYPNHTEQQNITESMRYEAETMKKSHRTELYGEGFEDASNKVARDPAMFCRFEIPHSQGCKLGERTAAAHIYALKEMGVSIEVKTDRYIVTHNGLNNADFPMFEAGDTACENALLAAALIPGTTTIRFASSNYMVQDVCLFLQQCGVKIEGVGTSTLIVHGIEKIDQEIEFSNSEDPIEAMMFIAAAATTESELTIQRIPIDFLTLELYRLKLMGLHYDQSPVYLSYNGHTRLVDVTLYPSKFHALPEKIHALPYPGINMDNLPFFVPIAIKAEGDTMIHDWSYENRAIYYMEMTKLGAEMILADPHRVYIKGTGRFKPAEVVAPAALRPAVIVLLGMLAAPGESILRNVYMINRGYEEIAQRLNALGAKITVIKE
jgi:UDP-N-acetylglucosamine 1-carboxyvinyltransferase